MTTALDTELIPAVFDLLQDFGKQVTYRTFPSRTVDETTSEVTLGTATDYTVRVTPPEKLRKPVERDADPLTFRGVFRVYLPTGYGTSDAIAFTPTEDQNHQIIADGSTLHVLVVEPIYSGDLVVLFQIDVSD